MPHVYEKRFTSISKEHSEMGFLLHFKPFEKEELVCWPIYRDSGVETVFVISLFKPSHNEHGGMRGGAVHIQQSEKVRNSSDYPASGMTPKQKKGAAQRRSTIPPPRTGQKNNYTVVGGMLFVLPRRHAFFLTLCQVIFSPIYFFVCMKRISNQLLKPSLEAIIGKKKLPAADMLPSC
jgi:hypothetical protein